MLTKTEVWPNGMPRVGQKARRLRDVGPRDIEFFTEISGDRNPLHYDAEKARATLADGTVVLDGTAVCYTMPLPS